jgi:hypothetical protein
MVADAGDPAYVICKQARRQSGGTPGNGWSARIMCLRSIRGVAYSSTVAAVNRREGLDWT